MNTQVKEVGEKRMNEIVINVISIIVTSVVLPVITYAGIKLTEWLNTKIKDEKSKAILNNISEVILNNVATVFQTYVEALKKENQFDSKAQNNALRLAKERIIKELNDEELVYISDKYGDANTWLNTQIESTIYKLKNKG